MKYLNEYREQHAIEKIAGEIACITTRPWTLMEVCGGQTHAIVRYGLQAFLPKDIGLLHGPGCPVCVTPLEMIDHAITIASRREVIFCSFGDMLRVPGSKRDLLTVKASGGDVRIVYSPLDAVVLAQQHPDREVVFFAIGFETTAPANAMAIVMAKRKGLQNFSLLVSHFLVPPAIEAICAGTDSQVQGFLAAGHVCAVTGYKHYLPLVSKYRIPLVVTGFEPLDILEGTLMCVRQLERGESKVENQYLRAVRRKGNPSAQNMVEQVFTISSQCWRGIGTIEASGLKLRAEFSFFDAERRFSLPLESIAVSNGCISGQIMQGVKKPCECPHFGQGCTPEVPLGAPMVSSEGACAAYYHYNRQDMPAGYSR